MGSPDGPESLANIPGGAIWSRSARFLPYGSPTALGPPPRPEPAPAARGCVDHHVVGLAGGQQHITLHARSTGERVAVFSDERETGNSRGGSGQRANDCGRMHAQTRVDETHENLARDTGRCKCES